MIFSIERSFRKRLLLWVIIPGATLYLCVVAFIVNYQLTSQEQEIQYISRLITRITTQYIEGHQSILRTLTTMEKSMSPSDVAHRLQEVQRNFQLFERLVMLDSNGNSVATVPHGLTGIDFPVRFGVTGFSNEVITSPMISPHSHKLVVYLRVPSTNGGSIVAELNLEALQNFIQGFLVQGRSIILTDSFGNLIVHPDDNLVQSQGNIASLEMFQKTQDANNSSFYRENNMLYYGSVTKIPYPGWKLVVASSIRNIFIPITVLIVLISLPMLLCGSILLIALRQAFKSKVIAPIASYIERLSFVSKGEYPVAKLAHREIKELAMLGDMVDTMATKVKEREEALKVSKNFFQNVIDSMPSAIFWINSDMQICQSNKHAENILSKTFSENCPELLETVFDHPKDMLQLVAESLRTNSLKNSDFITINNTTERLYNMTVFPLQGAEGKGVILRLDDVTSRTRMEQLMIRSEIMKSIGGLAEGMAHEINNPLAGILAGIQNLERKFLPTIPANMKAAETVGCSIEMLQEYVKARNIPQIINGIKDSGSNAAQIVSKMFEFSTTNHSNSCTIRVGKLIETSLELASKDYGLQQKYDFSEMSILQELEENLPCIFCSEAEIEQVLFNLIKNSAQALRLDGYSGTKPVIRIRAYQQNAEVVIEVEDNGPGIAEQDQHKIFEPFFTTRDTGIGPGLGLAVSYFIITHHHGGALQVGMSPDGGAKFTITLPTTPECE